MTAAPVFDKPAPTLQRTGEDWVRHEGNGSPKIKPPPGVVWLGRTGKPSTAGRYYTRVTTFAKAIDETSKLMAWKMRGVLVGLGQRPDYVVAAAALTMSDADRKAADELAEKALDASGPSAALVGTALHTWTERLDRGEPLGFIPPHLVPLVDAYARLTAPLTFHHREVRMVCDDLQTAGTPDAIGTCSIPDPDGVVEGLRIIDLKSGKVAYPGPMSVQLATYGRSDLYDPATGERTPLEGVNQRWGLIVHTQQDGKVPPGLYWLNLEHGNEGIELCRLVRTWRKVKPAAILQAVDGLGPNDVAATLEDETTEQLQPAAPESPAPQLPAGAIVCGPGEPTAADVQAVAEFAQQLEDMGPAPAEVEANRALILGAVTTRDLGVLWDDHGALWPAELVDLAAERYRELKDREDLERPQAALVGALRGADGAELHRLWAQYGSTPVWTDEASAVAGARHRELTSAGLA